jgi:inner membrane protein
MMARSHVVVGIATWFASASSLHLSVLDPIYLACVVGGSLLPDIDHPRSWVGQRTRPVSTALASILGHRGITHSAFAVIGLSALLLHAGYRRGWVSALVIGYLSHLAADMLTPKGLRFAWPMKQVWALPICRTGSPAEPAIVLAFVGCVAWWFIRHHVSGSPHSSVTGSG